MSLAKLSRVDLGFETESILTFHKTPPVESYPTGASRVAFFQRLLPEMAGMAGVESVGVISSLPLAEDFSIAIMAEGMPKTHAGFEDGLVSLAAPRAVSPGFFTALGLRVMEGQFFDVRNADEPLVAVVSDGFAREAWPDAASALGKRIAFPSENPDWWTVVGVVQDTREEAGIVASDRYRDAYFPLAQLPATSMYVTLRTSIEPTALVGAARQRDEELDPRVPVSKVRTMDEVVGRAMAGATFSARIMTVLAVVGLLLGAVGVYGVVSFTVGRRVREVAIRMSLGANSAKVASGVVLDGMKPVVLGVLAGLPGIFIVNRLVRGLLFELGSVTPAILAWVLVILVSIALAASYLPARRATATDPMIVLSGE